MTLVPLPNNHFAVPVKKDARHFSINKNWLVYLSGVAGRNDVSEICLPNSRFTIVAMGDKITEEQAREIVGRKFKTGNKLQWQNDWDMNETGELLEEEIPPLESFRSLLTSLSLDKNVLIIKQNK